MKKGEFDALQKVIRKSVVRIRAVRPNNFVTVTPGTVIVGGSLFSYIIAHKKTFLGAPGTKYEVIFPDSAHTTVEVRITDVRMTTKDNGFAFFLISHASLDVDEVKAIKFKKCEASDSEEVFTLSLHQDINSPSYLARGHVTHAEMSRFFHDCSGYSYTEIGSPVCSQDGFLVGICHEELGILLAVNIKTITAILNNLHPEFTNMGTEEILIHLKEKFEAPASNKHSDKME